MANWPTLPNDLLRSIFERLDLENGKNIMDCLSFSAVCTHWRLMAISKGRHVLPHIMLMVRNYNQPSKLFGLSSTDTLHNFHLPNHSTKLLSTCCGSLEGWLITLDSSNNTIDIIGLFNPVSRRTILLPSLPKPQHSQQYQYVRASKSNLNQDYVVTCIHENKLYFCRKGDEKWTHFGSIRVGGGRGGKDDIGMLQDIIVNYNNNKSYVIYYFTIEIFDLQTCQRLMIITTTKPAESGIYNCRPGPVYVVMTPEEELLMITRYYGTLNLHTVGFVVHKLNEGDGNWNEVQSLGDHLVLFLGEKSIFLRASDVPECQGNSIYFTGGQTGFFHMENGCIKLLCESEHHPFKQSECNWITWFTPNLQLK